jgi:argininosuccinate lyase
MAGDSLRTGRLGDDRPESVTSFLSSMEADRWIGNADVLVDIAHVMMLERQGIIERQYAATLLSALLPLHRDGLPEEIFDERHEDIHAGIEAYLIESAGMDAGGRLHIGRSRNDEVATCIRIRLRELVLEELGLLAGLRRLLIDTAREHTGTMMPGFTHLQHAQPTTLAHHLMAYEAAFSRDFERFAESLGRIGRSPLGAAAFASTGYPIDRALTAGLLGFERIEENTMDAVAARDVVIEAISDCAILMSTVSRLCEELVLWSSSFVAFVELPDACCSTSSIMPQKKNPDTAEIMRAKAGTVTGALIAALTIVKALPMSYNRDLQELSPHLWKAAFESGRCTRLLCDMLKGARFNKTRMREEAAKGGSTATELADVLVREYGLPFRTAHGIVGRAVRLGRLDLATLDAAAREMAGISLLAAGLDKAGVARALDPEFGISVRKAPGGPAPEAVQASISAAASRLDGDESYVAGRQKAISRANERMIQEAQELIASQQN